MTAGDGWNDGWTASVDGSSLGTPSVVDGGSGGWWIPPGPDGERTVELTWTPQRWTWLALAVSLLGVIGCLAVIWRSRRSDAARTAPAAGDAVVGSPGPESPGVGSPGAGSPGAPEPLDDQASATTGRSGAGLVAAAAVTTFAVVGWPWAIAVAILAAVCVAVSRPQLMAWVGLAIVASVALFYVEHQYRYRSPAGFGWVVNVDAMHHRTLAALVLIAMGLVGRRRRSSRAIPRDHSDEPVASGAV
ncbi:MAG: hypothetical protein R2715_08445 [Ilumatobacteraceae bacterium]